MQVTKANAELLKNNAVNARIAMCIAFTNISPFRAISTTATDNGSMRLEQLHGIAASGDKGHSNLASLFSRPLQEADNVVKAGIPVRIYR